MVTCLARHGEITLEQALAHSCNVAFAHIALELERDATEICRFKGFNAGLDVDGIKTAAGRVNVLAAEGRTWPGQGSGILIRLTP